MTAHVEPIEIPYKIEFDPAKVEAPPQGIWGYAERRRRELRFEALERLVKSTVNDTDIR